jgi:hypothetical protein
VRGAIPAPTLEIEQMQPTATDRHVLMTMSFFSNQCTTKGNLNRRKFERLETLGWIKGFSANLSDVIYELLPPGKEARKIKVGDTFRLPHPTTKDEAIFAVETIEDKGARNMFARKMIVSLVAPDGHRQELEEKQIRPHFVE